MSQPPSPLHPRNLKDTQWKPIASLLPPPKRGRGEPRLDDGQIFNGIFWILLTSASWRDLPSSYGSWQTIYHRFNQMVKDGTLARIVLALQIRLERTGKLDLNTLQIDNTLVGLTNQQLEQKITDQALGRSSGDFPARFICLPMARA